MKKNYTRLFLVLALVFNYYGEAQSIEWDKTIGGNDTEELTSIIPTSDGGFLLFGNSESNISGHKTEDSKGQDDYWIVKINSVGNVLWDKTIGGDSSDFLSSAEETSDGGFILAGTSYSGISGDKTEDVTAGADYWVVKLNSVGDIIWEKSLDLPNSDQGESIIQTYDGGYIIGRTSNFESNGKDYWITKLNSTGDIMWAKTFGGSDNDEFASIKQTSEGGYILGGSSDSGISVDKTESSNGGRDYWILKIDPTGVIEWQKTIGGNSYDELSSIGITSDGGYVISGISNSNISGDKTEDDVSGVGSPDFWVVKLNNLGNIEWDKTLGGNDSEWDSIIKQTSDTGYLVGGRSSSDISGVKTENSRGFDDYWLVKLDNLGTVLWDKTMGGDQIEFLKDIVQTDDGGFLVGGNSQSGISGDKTEDYISFSLHDFWIVKLSPATLSIEDDIVSHDLSIFPNPVKESLKIRTKNLKPDKVIIYSTNGELLKEFNDIDDNFLDVSNLFPGVYLIQIFSGNSVLNDKIIKY